MLEHDLEIVYIRVSSTWSRSAWSRQRRRVHIVFEYGQGKYKRVYGVTFVATKSGRYLNLPPFWGTYEHVKKATQGLRFMNLSHGCSNATTFSKHMPRNRRRRPGFHSSNLPHGAGKAIRVFVREMCDRNKRFSTRYFWRNDA